MEKRLMVVGARPHSLGMHVATAGATAGWTVTTAGIGDEDVKMDVVNAGEVREAIKEEMPHSVVCTVGINTGPASVVDYAWDSYITNTIETNTIGPLRVLREWVRAWHKSPLFEEAGWQVPMHFAAISSNSDTIARSLSAGYCASKAALTMALRCVGRELAESTPMSIYSYSPGWLDGTPMSQQVMDSFVGPVTPTLHRIPGNRILNPVSLATLIVQNLQIDRRYLNGTTIRLDGGEQ
jgi:NAD(P)-dependent dehydrogenase (short-subunit alcohol dehydrogenase family)